VRVVLALIVLVLLFGCDRGPANESNQAAIEARAKLLEQVANASVDASIAKIVRDAPDAETDVGARSNQASKQ
jgi:hypothetical protein